MNQSFTVRQDGPRVVLIVRAGLSETALEMPWNVADDLVRALREKARDAEELAKAEGIAFDQALLLRTGAPFGFSSREDIQREAAKEAAWNSDLRRYLPGGVRGTRQMGRPNVYHGRGGNGDGDHERQPA